MKRLEKKIVSIIYFLLYPFSTSSFPNFRSIDAIQRTARLATQISPENDVSPSQQRSKYTTLPRLYVGSLPTLSSTSMPHLKIGARTVLSPDQAHYATKVMRIGGKQQTSSKPLIRIFDGAHGEWLAEIVVEEEVDNGKRRRTEPTIAAICLSQLRPQQINHQEPLLYIAPLKKARIKMILEKCTELGVGGFTMVTTDRTDTGSERDCQDIDKLAAQIIEACEQCERLTIPSLVSKEKKFTIRDLLNEFKDSNRQLLICRERSSATPILVALSEMKADGISFLVGPEGGWSREEELLFDSYSSKSICGVSLGSNVLRAETAAVTTVAACALYSDTLN